MAMCKLTILCALVSMVVLCAQGLPRFHALQKREEGTRLCGRMLGDVMALVCNNVYYDPSNQQRVAKKRNYSKYEGPASWRGQRDSEEFSDPQAALEFLRARKLRNTGGVADECCKKPCTYAVLLSYCGSDNLVLE